MPTGTPLRQDVKQAYSWLEHRYHTYKNSNEDGQLQEVQEQLLIKYDDIENVLTESKEYLISTSTVDPLFSKLIDKLASLWRKTKLEIDLYQLHNQQLDYGQLLQLRLQRDDLSDFGSVSSRTTNTSRFEDEGTENSGKRRQYVPHLTPLYRAVIRAKIKKIKHSKVKELDPTFKQKPTTNLQFDLGKTTRTSTQTTKTVKRKIKTTEQTIQQRDVELSASDSEPEFEPFPWVDVSDNELDTPDYEPRQSLKDEPGELLKNELIQHLKTETQQLLKDVLGQPLKNKLVPPLKSEPHQSLKDESGQPMKNKPIQPLITESRPPLKNELRQSLKNEPRPPLKNEHGQLLNYEPGPPPKNIENVIIEPSALRTSAIEEYLKPLGSFDLHAAAEQIKPVHPNIDRFSDIEVSGDNSADMDEDEEYNEHYPDNISKNHSSIKPTLHIPSHLETIGESEDEDIISPPIETHPKFDCPKRPTRPPRPHIIPSVIITHDDGLETIPEVLTCDIEGTFEYNTMQPALIENKQSMLLERKQIQYTTSSNNNVHDLSQSINDPCSVNSGLRDKPAAHQFDVRRGNETVLQRPLTGDDHDHQAHVNTSAKEQPHMSYMSTQNDFQSNPTRFTEKRLVHPTSITSHTQTVPLYEFLSNGSQIIENITFQTKFLSYIPTVLTKSPTISKHERKIELHTAETNAPTFFTLLVDNAKTLLDNIGKPKLGAYRQTNPQTLPDRNPDQLSNTNLEMTLQSRISIHDSSLNDPSLEIVTKIPDLTRIIKTPETHQCQDNSELPQLNHPSETRRATYEETQTNPSRHSPGTYRSANNQSDIHSNTTDFSHLQSFNFNEVAAYLHTQSERTPLYLADILNSVSVQKSSYSKTPSRQLEAAEFNDSVIVRGLHVDQFSEEESVHELSFSNLRTRSERILRTSNEKLEESYDQLDISITDSGLGSFLLTPQSVTEEEIYPHRCVSRQKVQTKDQTQDHPEVVSSTLQANAPDMEPGVTSVKPLTLSLGATETTSDLSENLSSYSPQARLRPQTTDNKLTASARDQLNPPRTSSGEYNQTNTQGNFAIGDNGTEKTSHKAEQKQKPVLRQLSNQPDLLEFESFSNLLTEKLQPATEDSSQKQHQTPGSGKMTRADNFKSSRPSADMWDGGTAPGQDNYNINESGSTYTRRQRLRKSCSSASDLETTPYSINRRKKIHAKTIETQTAEERSEGLSTETSVMSELNTRDEPVKRKRNWWIFLIPFSIIVIALTILLYVSTNCNDRTSSCHWWFYRKRFTRLPPH